MNKDIDIFDNMPNKESMRGSHHKMGWTMKMYDQGFRNYKIVSRYIDRCLRKSIGKNFDKVKKHIYEKMSHNIIARHEDNIVDHIICRYIGENEKFILDSQNRIQLNKVYLEKCKKWRNDRMSGKLTIIDILIVKIFQVELLKVNLNVLMKDMLWLKLLTIIGQHVLHMKRLIWLKVRYMNRIMIYLKTNE